MPASPRSNKKKEKVNEMSLFLIEIRHKISACRYARTLGCDSTLADQLSMLDNYAERHELMVVDTILDHNGGEEIDRIKIEELYSGVEKGKYEMILVVNSGRIANNPKDVEAFCKKIEALGGIVYSLEEGYCSFYNN